MSLIEAVPGFDELDIAQQRRTVLQQKIGESFLISSQTVITPFVRQWETGNCDKDRSVVRRELHIGLAHTIDGTVQGYELKIADDVEGNRLETETFSALTGVTWDAAQVWTVDSKENSL
jgi:hypothetical protein